MTTLSPTNHKNQVIKTSSEIELILGCACTHLDTSSTARMTSILHQHLNWKYIIQTAIFHKVTPLIYQTLNNHFSALVPKQILDQLLSYFQTNIRRNLFLTNQLLQLLTVFQLHKISAIPIKGPILAISCYGNLGLRQFNDIDILVRPQDAIKARDLLVAQGYQSTYKFTREEEISRLKSPYCKDNNYTHKLTGVNLDFHWQLLQKYLSFPIDYQQVWERHQLTSLAGQQIPNLSPEDHLLFLCMHGSRDRWNKLQLICDITNLIRAYPAINWGWVIAEAKNLGCWRRFLLGIILAKNLFSIEISGELLQIIKTEPTVQSLAAQITAQLFCPHDNSSTLFKNYIFDLNTRERLQDKLNYCFYQSILVIARNNNLFPAWI